MELEGSVLGVIKDGSLHDKMDLLSKCWCRPEKEFEAAVEEARAEMTAKNRWVEPKEEYLAAKTYFGAEAEEICYRLLKDKSVTVRRDAVMRAERVETRFVARRFEDWDTREKAENRRYDAIGGVVYEVMPKVKAAISAWQELNNEARTRLLAQARKESGQKEGYEMEARLTELVSLEVVIQERLSAAKVVALEMVSGLPQMRQQVEEGEAENSRLELAIVAAKDAIWEENERHRKRVADLEEDKRELEGLVTAGEKVRRDIHDEVVEDWARIIAEQMAKGMVPLDQFNLPHSLEGPVIDVAEGKVYAIHGVVVKESLFQERPEKESPAAAKRRIDGIREAMEHIENRAYGDPTLHQKGFKIPSETAAWLMHQLTGRDLDELFTQGYGKVEEQVRRFVEREFDV